MLTMPAPLTASDARLLGALTPPAWARQVAGAAIFLLVAMKFGAGIFRNEIGCSDAAPCLRDPLGVFYAGFVLGLLPLGWISLRLNAVVAVAVGLLEIIYNSSGRYAVPSTAWEYALTWSYVLTSIGLALWLDRPRQAPAWQGTVTLAIPPSPPRRTRLSRAAYLGGSALLVLAGVLAWISIDQRRHEDARQRAADVVQAQVIKYVDSDLTVQQSNGRRSTIYAHNTNGYPEGSTIALWVDDEGLIRPVAQPYDGTDELRLGATLAPSGLCLILRARRRRRDLTRAFAEERPVTSVFIHSMWKEVVIYPADAVPGSPPAFAMRIVPGIDGPIAAAIADGRYDPRSYHYPAQPAELYGLPVPGQWCVLVTSDRVITPTGPLTETRSTTRFIPPYPWQV